MTTARQIREVVQERDPPTPDLSITIPGRLRHAVAAALWSEIHQIEAEAARTRRLPRTRGDNALQLERAARELRCLAQEVAP
jgi:hypothetical protein